jgi:predicted exporter
VLRTLAFAALAAVCAAYVAWRVELRTSITDFLPADQHGAIELARELSSAPQARVVVFTIGAREGSVHRRAAAEFADALRASGSFEWVRSGISEDDEQGLYQLAFPARLGLLPMPGQAGPIPDAFLAERIAAMRARLAGPLGMLERRLAPDDPLGAFASVIEAQAAGRGRLSMVDRQLVTDDGAWSVLFAATRGSAFDARAQAQVEARVNAAFAPLARRDPSLTLEWSGLNRFALEGERSVRGDIERISTLSVFGIFLLYLLVFRSLREPLLVLLPIGFGCLLATAVCQLVFGYVHGLALAFGSSIIGVAEDYSTHYFAHRLHAPASEDNEALMRRLLPGMLLGALTTIAGICTLFASGFRGLEQMATFGALGVLGALACTRYVFPTLSRKQPREGTSRMGRAGAFTLDKLAARPWLALWFIGPSLIVFAVGAPRLHFEDSLKALRTRAPALDAENEAVQQRIGRSGAGQVVIALGHDDEQALARSEQALSKMEEAGVRARSISTFLPSLASQRARRARMTDDTTFLPRLRAELTRQGFVPEAFAGFERALQAPPVELTPEVVERSAFAASWLAPFRAQLRGQVAYLTSIESSTADVGAMLQGLEGVHFLDQEALYREAYRGFRTRTLWLLGLGLLLVLGILLARYRSAKVAVLGMVPAFLGAGAAIGIEALRGVPATVMHVIGVLLVLSMGVDYGIYALESQHSAEEGVTTLGSVVLAAMTTVLSFGLLGLSRNPALAAVGNTVGFGLVFTVLASPVLLAFTRRPGTERT